MKGESQKWTENSDQRWEGDERNNRGMEKREEEESQLAFRRV